MSDILNTDELFAEVGEDLNMDVQEIKRELPTEGPTRLRCIKYIELGTHQKPEGKFGKKPPSKQLIIGFELSGPKHKPREFDGKREPITIDLYFNNVRTEKAALTGFWNLIKATYPALRHPSQCVSSTPSKCSAFLSTVSHYPRGDEDKNNKAAWTGWGIKGASGYVLNKPVRYDEDDNPVPVAIESPISKPMVFLWETPNISDGMLLAMWDSLFIDGSFTFTKDGKETTISRNKYQEKIKAALDFPGSRLETLLKQREGTAISLPPSVAAPSIPGAPATVATRARPQAAPWAEGEE